MRLYLLFWFFICGHDVACVVCRHGIIDGIASNICRHNMVSIVVGEKNRVLGLVLWSLKDVFICRAYFGFVDVYSISRYFDKLFLNSTVNEVYMTEFILHVCVCKNEW